MKATTTLIAIACLTATYANAQVQTPQQVNFTGQVSVINDPSGWLDDYFPGFTVGSTLEFQYIYTTPGIDIDADSDLGDYRFDATFATARAQLDSADFESGGSFTSVSVENGEILGATDGYTLLGGDFWGFFGTQFITAIATTVRSTNDTLLSNDELPIQDISAASFDFHNSMVLQGQLRDPLDMVNGSLSSFSISAAVTDYSVSDYTGGGTITPQGVPEPATSALFIGGGIALAVALRRRKK